MRSKALLMAAFLAAAPGSALAQAQTDTMTPTIPASQIEALQLSSTYEFLSAASGIDEFQTKSAALAARLAQSPEVKAFAEKLSAAHLKLVEESAKAGLADDTDIAAANIDGEQQGLLTKMEVLEGAEFDRAYLEAQLFVHQRAIAIYKGFSDRDNNLGRFAQANLPAIVGRYEEALALAQTLGIGAAAQTQAPVGNGEPTEAQGEDAAGSGGTATQGDDATN